MAMTTTYLTVNGKIRSEQRAGEAHSRDYVLDPLGSVIQIYQNGWPIADACYEPYGGIYTQWNMEGKTFTWLGGWGYRQTGVEWSSVYVRARHYSRGLSNWTSIDPLWPSEMAYGYVEGRVMTGVDYWGMQGANTSNSGTSTRPCVDQAILDWLLRLLGGLRVNPVSIALTPTATAGRGTMLNVGIGGATKGAAGVSVLPGSARTSKKKCEELFNKYKDSCRGFTDNDVPTEICSGSKISPQEMITAFLKGAQCFVDRANFIRLCDGPNGGATKKKPCAHQQTACWVLFELKKCAAKINASGYVNTFSYYVEDRLVNECRKASINCNKTQTYRFPRWDD